MNQRLEKVKEFMETFGQLVATEPTIPEYHVRELRSDLLEEELEEFVDAVDNDDINEIADAIVDMAYVHYGTMLTYGVSFLDPTHSNVMDNEDCCIYVRETNELVSCSRWAHASMQGINVAINTLAKRLLPEGKFDDLFNEVHRSNMSKFCKTIEEAKETQAHYLEKGVKSNIVEKNNAFVVYSEKGKVLKSIYYSPANLQPILSK